MIDDKILRAAEQFIERFGSKAPREAAFRAEELASLGDAEGAALWRRIGELTRSLLQSEKPARDREH